MSLDNREKELVAIGAAIGGNYIPCLKWHYKKCIEAGFAKEEIQEAINMAKMVKDVLIKNINEVAEKLLSQ